MKQVLTVAGSDSGGGAGIQADIKAISANGAYAMSVVTAITAQNTQGVTAALDMPVDLIVAQLDAIYDDFAPDAVKTGMLSSAEVVNAVASSLAGYGVSNLVVDPVMISKSGFPLLKPDAIDALKTQLWPLAEIVTPNANEASLIAGIEIRSIKDSKETAKRLSEIGSAWTLVKGGHVESGDKSVDVLYDGFDFTEFTADRIDTTNTHGTGCTYSAAIATFLARGLDVPSAVGAAKEYVTGAIRHAPHIGHGHGPTHHFWRVK